MFPQPSWTERPWLSSPWADRPGQPCDAVERAVILTVAYSDVFDFPLTPVEIHRYLIGRVASPAAVQDGLARGVRRGYLTAIDGHVTLAGRAHLVERRAASATRAAALWEEARRYGRFIAELPFVRLVAVSGALAVDNVGPGADIDYFLVTESDRLWVCRALVVALVRWAARRGTRLCPNYLVSERALALPDRNLFTAHELVQLVPLAGFPVYRRLRRENAWTAAYLPNAVGPPRQSLVAAPGGVVTRLAEHVGRSRLGDLVEHWERTRKVKRFAARANGSDEAQFGRDWCKGHFDAHGRRALEAFGARLRQLELVR